MNVRTLVLVGLLAGVACPVVHGQTDWPNYSHDAGGTRFSPLGQITPANASKMKLIWTFDSTAPMTDAQIRGEYGNRRPPAAAPGAANAPAAAPGAAAAAQDAAAPAAGGQAPSALIPGAPAAGAGAAGAPGAGGAARAGAAARPRVRTSKTTPLVVGDTMYLSTPYNRLVALSTDKGTARNGST